MKHALMIGLLALLALFALKSETHAAAACAPDQTCGQAIHFRISPKHGDASGNQVITITAYDWNNTMVMDPPPSGTITIDDINITAWTWIVSAPIQLVNGQATYVVPGDSVGDHQVSPSYNGGGKWIAENAHLTIDAQPVVSLGAGSVN